MHSLTWLSCYKKQNAHIFLLSLLAEITGTFVFVSLFTITDGMKLYHQF